eukprot:SAG25_NODE_4015_length_907_cov_1.504950_1_plen_287_part_01
MDACCPAPGGHRRLQTQCALPSTCGTLHCAEVFTSFYEDCTQMVGSSPAYQSFYANCQELQAQSAQMLLQPVAVQMFKVHIATNVTMGPPPPPVASSSGDSSALQEYHAVCSSAAIGDCVPVCNATHHGYELLATIDGTDTKFSCNLAHGLYSWVGAATEGGYLGADSDAFFSAVKSGAAGSYVVTLNSHADFGLGTFQIQSGQHVYITGQSGDSQGCQNWTRTQIELNPGASLTLTSLCVQSMISVRGGKLRLVDVKFTGDQSATIVNMGSAGSGAVIEVGTLESA